MTKTIKRLYNDKVPTILASQTVDKALEILEKTKSSAVLVLDDDSLPIGIITERDVSKQAGHWDEILLQQAYTIMSSPLLTIYEDTDFRDAYMTMTENGYRHLVVVNHENKLLGLLSEGDFLKYHTPEQLLAAKDVNFVMSTNVITVTKEYTVSQSISLMNTKKISSVVIVENDKPIGIFTERDSIHLARQGDHVLLKSIDEYMSSPVKTIHHNYSILEAEHILNNENIRRLIVVDDDGKLAGIITQHDLVKGISGIYVEMLRDTIRKQSDILYDTYSRLEEQSVLNNILNSFADRLIIACDTNSIIEYSNALIFHCLYSVPEKGKTLDNTLKCFNSSIADSILKGESKTVINCNPTVIDKEGEEHFFRTTYSPIFSDKKVLQGFLFTAEDITNEQKSYRELQETKTRLEKSELQFRKIFESARDGILIVDIEGKKFYMGNEAISNMLGYHEDELKTLGMMDIHPKESLASIFKEFERQKNREIISATDVPLLRKDGSIFYADIATEKIELDGKDCMLGVFHDITQAKENQKILQEKNLLLEEREKQLLQAQEIAKIGNWSLDIKSMNAYWSDEIRDIAGIDAHTAVGPEFLSTIVYPEDWPALEASLMGAIKDGKSHHMEYRVKRPKDGETCWVDCRGIRLNDQNGQPLKIVGTFQDITENKLAEQKERKLLDLIDSSNNEFYVFDKNTFMFTYVNNGALKNLQYSLEELKNMHPYDIKPEYTYASFNQVMKELVEQKTSQMIFETLHLRKDGTTYPVEVHIQLLNTFNNQEFLAVIIDITKRKEIELKLREQEELMIVQSRQAAMGEMISMIAHQWRQPLTVVSMAANNLLLDIALDNLNKTSAVKELNTINEQTQYMSHTIDDFRNFFQHSKTLETDSVNNILADVVKIIGPALYDNEINIAIDCDSTITIQTYKSELTQVIINILSNAKDILKDKKEERNINIIVKELDENINITIYNNGFKIPVEIIDTIFEPYFTTKGESGGTGLGLYMSKAIIEKHMYGTIKAVNTERGVEFIIIIPKSLQNKSNE